MYNERWLNVSKPFLNQVALTIVEPLCPTCSHEPRAPMQVHNLHGHYKGFGMCKGEFPPHLASPPTSTKGKLHNGLSKSLHLPRHLACGITQAFLTPLAPLPSLEPMELHILHGYYKDSGTCKGESPPHLAKPPTSAKGKPRGVKIGGGPMHYLGPFIFHTTLHVR